MSDADLPARSYDICLTLGITETMKAKGHTVTIHHVDETASLADIKQIIRQWKYDDEQPAIGAGLYWLRRKGQDCIDLKTEADLEKAKAEHTTKGAIKDLRLAVAALPKKKNRKRLHAASNDSDEELAHFIHGKSAPDKTTNSHYNNAFVQLVRDLERKGTKSSYTNKHLNLWAEHIMQGSSSGAEDPPNWEQFLEQVEFLPRDRKAPFTNFPSAQRRDSLSEMMLMQMSQAQEERRLREQERREERSRQEALDRNYMRQSDQQRQRDDLWRTTMLAMMFPNAPRAVPGPSTSASSAATTQDIQRPLIEMSVDDVSMFLAENGFECHVSTFVFNAVDGATLHHANHELLEALGISCVIQRAKLLGLVSKANQLLNQ